MVSAEWLALGERRARALGVSEPRSAGAIGAAGAGAAMRAAAETGEAGRAGQPVGQAQAAAQAVASEPVEQLMEQPMEQQMAQAAEQQVEPRAAVAAQPHKRRAVLAATAVGAVQDGGKQPGWATQATNDALVWHSGRVERRGAWGARRRGARRRLVPYARAAEVGAAEA